MTFETPVPASRLPEVGTTIFSVMSALAVKHGAVNLGQGFPDFDCDPRLIDAVDAAMRGGLNQYPPMAGVPALRERIAEKMETLYGRRRLVPELRSRNFQDRSAAERVAVNMPIQGTAADIMKRAMIDVQAALEREPGSRMILTVHDELLFEVPRERADSIRELVREQMQGAASLDVPLTVDVGMGSNWKEAKS